MQQVRIRLLSNGFLAKMLFVLPFDTGDGRLPPCLTSWCNSDVESVLLCPSARCFLIKLSLLGVFCCAPGPDVFWYRDLNQNLGACPGQDCRQRREGQDQLAAYLPAGHGSGSCSPSLCGGRRHVQHVRIRWLSYGFQCRDALCSHIQRWLWEVVFLFITSWCKSDVESVLLCQAARFYFEKVIFMWGVVFCILSFWLKDETVVMEGVSFYFPTSWCNSDVGRITFCLTSWCNSDDGICFLLCPWASLLQMRLSVMDVLSLCFLFHIKMQLWCWEDFFLPHIMILLW